ncbi:hypothetical protein HDEF_2092 [Candidatus Hamiltonella defensa 5AT (Acyrthosiphon pisum)]|uniref:Uncharacterized protein n=1 Tax=Hamiltonella defensa subsp. Acyrthosiphon pisum (strain 5AT) TaxID=572265 RepID=C4K7W5_HAMD5|nr:hypothetical protein HDEF_2092 [Candidatus Hamiltonella defensa 5AT (Acyrthosiphon pisum)]
MKKFKLLYFFIKNNDESLLFLIFCCLNQLNFKTSSINALWRKA